MKYSILSIFRAKQKMTLRPSRKHCSLLCVFVMKEYLLNCSSIRLDYDLLVFSSRFLLPKMKVFDNWKKELSNFHELLESARARASFENWFCVESRVTAFTGKKNQVKRLLSRWSTTLFRCTCLYGHWIKVFFKIQYRTSSIEKYTIYEKAPKLWTFFSRHFDYQSWKERFPHFPNT